MSDSNSTGVKSASNSPGSEKDDSVEAGSQHSTKELIGFHCFEFSNKKEYYMGTIRKLQAPSFRVVVTNGENTWISADLKYANIRPSSLDQQNIESYRMNVNHALKMPQSDSIYEETDHGSHKKIKIISKIGGLNVTLCEFKVTLNKSKGHNELYLFSKFGQKLDLMHHQLDKLKRENDILRKQQQDSDKSLNEAISVKEHIEHELMTKFVKILNEKKKKIRTLTVENKMAIQKIRKLNDQLDNYKNDNNINNNNNNNDISGNEMSPSLELGDVTKLLRSNNLQSVKDAGTPKKKRTYNKGKNETKNKERQEKSGNKQSHSSNSNSKDNENENEKNDNNCNKKSKTKAKSKTKPKAKPNSKGKSKAEKNQKSKEKSKSPIKENQNEMVSLSMSLDLDLGNIDFDSDLDAPNDSTNNSIVGKKRKFSNNGNKTNKNDNIDNAQLSPSQLSMPPSKRRKTSQKRISDIGDSFNMDSLM